MQPTDLKQLKNNLQQLEIHTKDYDPTVIAVTKFVNTDVMRHLHDLGWNHFGENRMQVLEQKLEELDDIKDQITWHYIGRVQRRQVRRIINRIDYLHSLDRLSLANEIQKRAEQVIPCFVQVNISGEEQKAGFTPEALEDAVKSLAEYDKIKVIGLMTMAPYDAEEDELEEIFSTLHELRNQIKDLQLPHAPCTELSMGMSRDYPIALENDASYIRVGSTLYEGLDQDLFL